MKTAIIKDTIGNSYIGINIPKDNIDFNTLLNYALNNIKDFKIFNDKLLKRNHGEYHITIFNSMVCNKYKNLFFYNGLIINDIKITGLGSIEKNNKITYFITCESIKLNMLLSGAGLNAKDFHITIGFTDKDLFHDRKNISNIVKL